MPTLCYMFIKETNWRQNGLFRQTRDFVPENKSAVGSLLAPLRVILLPCLLQTSIGLTDMEHAVLQRSQKQKLQRQRKQRADSLG